MANTAQNARTVALIQTARDDLRLRGENLRAFALAGLTPSANEVLSLSDLPSGSKPPFPSTKFALVDHNRLGSLFADTPNATVVAVVDHHDDEGLYKDTTSPRLIQVPTGSCASLVGQLIANANATPPPGLATLLLSAILVDTNGLKPNKKAVDADYAGAAFLAVHSSLPDAGSLTGDLQDNSEIQALNTDLQDRKASVEHLSTRDLLRRDYKEYTFVPHWSASTPVQVGLASVPVGFAEWFISPRAKDGLFWTDTEGWVKERGLAALGILTSFRDASELNSQGKPKHRREQVWVLPPDAPAGLAERLWEGLDAAESLRLREHKFKELGGEKPQKFKDEGWQAKIFKQKETDATRKITAPVVKAIIEGPQTGGKL